MEIRIMLFILMMMVMPVSYAACYSELSVQHNLVVQGDFALTQTQMATYEHNFNDSSCVSTNTITPMSPSDIIVGLYNDTIKLNLHFEWTNKNNITVQEKPHIACREVLLFVDTWKAERYNQIRK